VKRKRGGRKKDEMGGKKKERERERGERVK